MHVDALSALGLQGDLSPEADDRSAVGTLEENAPADDTPKDHGELEQLAKLLNGQYLAVNEVAGLVGIDHGKISHAESHRAISQTSRRLTRGHGASFALYGFRLDGVVAWIIRNSVPYSITPIGKQYWTVTPAAVIDADATYNVEQITRRFGIDPDVVLQAIAEGKIAEWPTVASPARVPGAWLLRWIEEDRPAWSPSFSIVKRVLNLRGVAAEASADLAQTREPDVTDLAFNELASSRAAEAEDDRKGRAGMWRAYCSILQRRTSPAADDAKLLAELIVEMKLSRETIESHIAAIESMANLQAKHADIESATIAHQEACAAEQAEKARAKREAERLRIERGQAFSRLRDAREANYEIDRLRERFPDLFHAASGVSG